MAKSAAETDTAFDAVIRLGDVAPLAPANLSDAIYLGIRLTPEGDALDEIAWLIGRPSQAAKASVCARREPLLETITELFRNSHTTIFWDLRIPAPLPELPMDKSALNRAFMNILTNAAEVLLQSHSPNPEVSITVTCQSALNLVRIDFADNGPGLSEEERSRLFEPYFSRKKGGTGLGLTIVRSIVTDHRGYVRALPREGGGAIITMELPLA